MPSRRRSLVEATAFGVILALGVFHEHACRGVETRLFLLGALLSGSFFRRLLAFLGRAELPTPLVLSFELAALSGLLVYPVGPWGLAFAAIAAAALAWPPLFASRVASPRATRLEEGLVLVVAVAALAATRLDPWLAVPVFLLAIEAWGHGSPRSAEDAARRASGFSLLGLTAPLTSQTLELGSFAPVVLAATLLVAVAAGLDCALVRGLTGPSPEALAGRRRRVWRGLAGAGTTILAVWVAGEAALRILPTPYREVTVGASPDSSWHAPGKRYVYLGPMAGHREDESVTGNAFFWNKEGFHDRDHTLEKPAHCVRVAVLGDSYVEAVQLPLEKLFTSLLERALAHASPSGRAVEVLACGSAGRSLAEQLEQLETHVRPRNVDLVVLELIPALEVPKNAPVQPSPAARRAGERRWRLELTATEYQLYFTAMLVGGKLRGDLLHGVGACPVPTDEVYRTPPLDPALWEASWARTDALLGEIATATKEQGARLAVVLVPTPAEVAALEGASSTFNPRGPADRVLVLCQRRGIPCLSLLDRFLARHADTKALYLRYDPHWTALGHLWAAEETTAFLCQETNLWSSVLAGGR